jgi:hypothetical protein
VGSEVAAEKRAVAGLILFEGNGGFGRALEKHVIVS